MGNAMTRAEYTQRLEDIAIAMIAPYDKSAHEATCGIDKWKERGHKCYMVNIFSAVESICLLNDEAIGADKTAFERYGSMADHTDHWLNETENKLRQELKAVIGVSNE